MQNILLVLAILNIVSFAWSVIGVFKKVSERKSVDYFIMVLLSLTTYFFVIYGVYNKITDNVYLQILSIILMLFSFYLFWFTAKTTRNSKLSLVFSQDEPVFLITNGPYSLIRNPFYLSYLVCYFAAFIVSYNLFLLICFVFIYLIYMRAIIDEEKKFLNSPLAEKYQKFMETRGRFFPKFAKSKV